MSQFLFSSELTELTVGQKLQTHWTLFWILVVSKEAEYYLILRKYMQND